MGVAAPDMGIEKRVSDDQVAFHLVDVADVFGMR
jgi:hypothetical protein